MLPPSMRRRHALAWLFLIGAGGLCGASPAPYSIPWRLRAMVPVNVVRVDDDVAFYSDPQGRRGITNVATLLGALRLGRSFMPFVRIGAVSAWPPAGPQGHAVTNLVFGSAYALVLPRSFRLSLFLALAVPTGAAQGDAPERGVAAALKAGVPAQSSMDNAMFAVNDLVVFPGVDLAFVWRGLTVQLEATVLQLFRQFGTGDRTRTNFTSGLHVGYFPLRWLSLGVELRYQRWLSTPKAVAADPTAASRDNLTVAAGARFHVALPGGRSLRPGLSYTRGLDQPMAAAGYNILQLDVPFIF